MLCRLAQRQVVCQQEGPALTTQNEDSLWGRRVPDLIHIGRHYRPNPGKLNALEDCLWSQSDTNYESRGDALIRSPDLVPAIDPKLGSVQCR
jgi:hypothetical protein